MKKQDDKNVILEKGAEKAAELLASTTVVGAGLFPMPISPLAKLGLMSAAPLLSTIDKKIHTNAGADTSGLNPTPPSQDMLTSNPKPTKKKP